MIAGTAPPTPSVASLPAITRHCSTPSIVPSARASTQPVCTMSEPCMPSSSTCTALSAPIDSALRIASVGRSRGPGGQHGDRALGAVGGLFLLDQQRLFDGTLVDFVEYGVGGAAVERE